MGNRAVITTEEKQIGIYVHWNGGRESIETFLAYCDLKNYRPPETDDYGWARMCQVIGNFFGGSTSIGIDKYERLDRDNYDNGVYIIENWKVIGREFQHYDDEEIKSADDLEDNLNYLNEKQPKEEQLSKEEIHDYCNKWAKERGLYTKEYVSELYDKTRDILDSYDEHKDKVINYILENKKYENCSKAIASTVTEIIQVNPVTKEIDFVHDWDFGIDKDIFGELQDFNIAYMSIETHLGIWQYIVSNYPEGIDNKEGMQKYLKYCKNHEITKDRINEESKIGKIAVDAMKYYKPLDKEVR